VVVALHVQDVEVGPTVAVDVDGAGVAVPAEIEQPHRHADVPTGRLPGVPGLHAQLADPVQQVLLRRGHPGHHRQQGLLHPRRAGPACPLRSLALLCFLGPFSRIRELDAGDIETLVGNLARLRPSTTTGKDEVRKTSGYFESNAHRMRYADFRRRGLFVGSGVVEAGCKTIIGHRLKQSGMRWTVRGANAIIALRCCELSGRWETFWEARSA